MNVVIPLLLSSRRNNLFMEVAQCTEGTHEGFSQPNPSSSSSFAPQYVTSHSLLKLSQPHYILAWRAYYRHLTGLRGEQGEQRAQVSVIPLTLSSC